MRNLIYESDKSTYSIEKNILLLCIIGIVISIIIFNILLIRDSMTGIIKEEDLVKSTIGAILGDIIIVAAVVLITRYLSGREHFKIYEDGIVPPKVPKNRRRPKEKHFIPVNEIEKIDLSVFRQKHVLRKYLDIRLKDRTEVSIYDWDIKERGFEELIKFKEMHNIPGECRQLHPTLGWVKEDK